MKIIKYKNESFDFLKNLILKKIKNKNLSIKDLLLRSNYLNSSDLSIFFNDKKFIKKLIKEEKFKKILFEFSIILGLRKSYFYDIYNNKLTNKILLNDKGNQYIINEFFKNEKYKLIDYDSLFFYLKKIITFNTIEEVKQKYDKQINFHKHNEDLKVYFYIALLEKNYCENNIIIPKFIKAKKNTIYKNVLDILTDQNINFDIRCKKVKKFLFNNGIILNTVPYISVDELKTFKNLKKNKTISMNLNAFNFKRNNKKYLFVTDKNKREHYFIFYLMHELFHLYEVKQPKKTDDCKDFFDKKIFLYILNYLKVYSKKNICLKKYCLWMLKYKTLSKEENLKISNELYMLSKSNKINFGKFFDELDKQVVVKK